MAHFVTDKIVVGLQYAGAALLALAAATVVFAIGFTVTAEQLLASATIGGLAFGLPGLAILLLSHWLDGQVATIEGHPHERRAVPRDTEARHPFRAPFLGYAIAIVATGLSWGLRAILDPYLSGSVPFLTFFGAIAVSAWFGGQGPAIVSTVISAALARYFYMVPTHSMQVTDANTAIRLGTFVFIGLVIGGLVAALRAALLRVQFLAQKVEALEAARRESGPRN